MVSRIKKIIEDYDTSVRAFAIACGINQTTLDRQIKGKMAVSIDTVGKILSSNPNISAEWFMRGAGPMYNSEISNQSSERLSKLISTIGEMQTIIEEKQKAIDALQSENDKLKKQLK